MRTHPIVEYYQALRDSAPCLSRAATLPKGTKLGLGKRRAPGNTIILSQPYRRRVSTDRLNREGSQLAASLEGEPGPTPAGKTLPHSFPETSRFRRERAREAECGSNGYGCQPCSWSAEQVKCFFSQSMFAPENYVSRDRGMAVPSRASLLILHTQTESGASYFCGGVNSFIPITAIAPVPSLSGHATVYQAQYRWFHCRECAGTHRASSINSWPQGSYSSSSNGCCLLRYHHGPIVTRLSILTPTRASGRADMCDTWSIDGCALHGPQFSRTYVSKFGNLPSCGSYIGGVISKNWKRMEIRNQNAPRPSEHPPVREENMSKRLGGDQRLRIQNLLMAFKRVPRWK